MSKKHKKGNYNMNNKTIKSVAILAIIILLGYIVLVLMTNTYKNYAHFYIEKHCELIENYNGNKVEDNYYICDDWK